MSEFKNSMSIHVLSRALIIDQGHILLEKSLSKPGFYFLPGGHVEAGESVQQALKRELLEEMGLDFTLGTFWGCLEYSFDTKSTPKKCHNHEYNFIFSASTPLLCYNKLPAEQPGHPGEFEWIALKTLPASTLLPEPLTTLIPQWLAEGSKALLYTSMKQ